MPLALGMPLPLPAGAPRPAVVPLPRPLLAPLGVTKLVEALDEVGGCSTKEVSVVL